MTDQVVCEFKCKFVAISEIINAKVDTFIDIIGVLIKDESIKKIDPCDDNRYFKSIHLVDDTNHSIKISCHNSKVKYVNLYV